MPLYYGMGLGGGAGEFSRKTSRQVKAKVRVGVRIEKAREMKVETKQLSPRGSWQNFKNSL